MKSSILAGLVTGALMALTACTTAPSEPSTASALPAKKDTGSKAVTFEQVLANPDNPKLNLKYAKQQARKGNLERAISTMERLLIAEPAWDEARFYYMTLLDKVGDETAAMQQLAILEKRPLSAGLRGKVSGYRSKKVSSADFEPLL